MVNLIAVVNKSTHKEVTVSGSELTLDAPSVVRLSAKPSDVKNMERQGGTLIVTLTSGAVIKIHGFFSDQGEQQNDLVLQDNKQLWLMELSHEGGLANQFVPIDSIEPLLVNEHFDLAALAWVLGGVGAAGLALGGCG
ncbi:hypothetical protein CER19_05165, partial [Pseudomonas sp. GL93]|uniref:BapA/Bap/LapF family prefix-like domain-containing protein n=1 Tax=Pseudomonas sp. GL93 TaxID=2014741 RepID=UPI000E38AB6C